MRRWISTNIISGLFLMLFFVFILVSCGGSSSGDDDSLTEDPLGLPPVVFIAEKSFQDVKQLYITTDEGESFVDLSKRTPQMDEVTEFKISPDGNWVAFLANRAVINRFDLFIAPISGSSLPVNITSFSLSTQNVREYDWAPNSSRLAYIADQVTPGSPELFTVLPDGSDSRRLSGSLASKTEVKEFKWAPNSSLIAFTSDFNALDQFDLFTSAPDATDTFNVRSDPFPAIRDVSGFAWDPTSGLIAYLSNANSTDRIELFTTVAQPGSARDIRTVSALPADGRNVIDFAWDPINGSRIAYIADQDTFEIFELYTTLPDVDFASVKVSGTITPAGGDVVAFAWNPFDASRIAYRVDSDIDDVFELFTTEPQDDSGVVKLHDDLPSGRSVETFAWAPDGSRIAYTADQDSNDVTELFSSTPDSKSDNVKISGTLVLSGNVASFVWAPDSSRVAYRADQDTISVFELYSSLPNTAAGNTKVSGRMQAGGSVEADFKWAADSSGLGYVADQITDEVFELFETLPDGSKNKKVSGTLAVDGDVFEFDFVPD